MSAIAQLPDAATLDRTEEVIRKISEIGLKQPGVINAVEFPGFSINGFTNSSNAGVVFMGLAPFEERRDPSLSAGAIARELNQQFAAIPEAVIAVFPPPPVQGLGTIGGFKLQIEDQAGLGYEALDQATKSFLAKARTAPELTGLFSSFAINVPQLYADLDRAKARQLGVPVSEVFSTLQIYLGSVYVNDFNKFGRTYSVRVQADAPFRARADDIGFLKVRSKSGEMVPLTALLNIQPSVGPERATRYNGFLAADINGRAAPGYSSGQAQAAIERIAAETLPKGFRIEWTELTYQEILAGNSGILVFPIAILLVFLVLAAQYESLTLPVSIILIVPLALLAALSGVWWTAGDNNVFTQIGLIVLVGPLGQERDPDRGVRPRARVRGPDARRSGHRGQPPAPAADPDDLVGLHHGRGAAGDVDRGGGRDADRHGRGGVLGHDWRDGVRPVPHACLLRSGPQVGGEPSAWAPDSERTKSQRLPRPCIR